jgi:hypothetical protein
MARTTATPESRRESYGTKGRPMSDWEALKELWHGSERVREACNDAFTRFEKHAYAQPATQREADGRELTRLIWDQMRAAGYEVTESPVHFVRTETPATEPEPPADVSSPRAAPGEPGGSGSSIPPGAGRATGTGGSSGGAKRSPLVAIVIAVVAALVVLAALRRRRR